MASEQQRDMEQAFEKILIEKPSKNCGMQQDKDILGILGGGGKTEIGVRGLAALPLLSQIDSSRVFSPLLSKILETPLTCFVHDL